MTHATTLLGYTLATLIGIHTSLPVQAEPNSPTVELLIPVETGHELSQLLPRIPAAQLVEVAEKAYIRISSFKDARVAYNVGRSLQKDLRVPFELAYSEGHPQADGNWLKTIKQNDPRTAENDAIARQSSKTPIPSYQRNLSLLPESNLPNRNMKNPYPPNGG